MDKTTDEQNETADTLGVDQRTVRRDQLNRTNVLLEEATVETPVEQQVEETPADDTGAPEDQQEQEPETFPADVVHKLRDEAAKYRTRAKDRDDLAQQLFVARVAATGRLADPSDLPYDEGLLNDTAALDQAIGELLAAKPHLASRTPHGTIGQGPRSGDSGGVDLASMLRAGAR